MDGGGRSVRNSYPSWFVGACLLVLLQGSHGCRLASHGSRLCHLRHRADQQPPQIVATVFVGGQVRSPGAVALPPDGRLTLRQAIDQAGGVIEADRTDGDQVLWIGLRRGGGPLAHWTVMPWFFVEQDLGGDVPLAAGDEIRVHRHDETTLLLETAQRVGSTAVGEPFSVSGWVRRPGVRYIGQPAATLASGPAGVGELPQSLVTRLGDVLHHAAVDPRSALLILKRRNLSGLATEYYVFPLYDARSLALLTAAPIVSGDELVFGPITSSPLLASSLVDSLLRASVPRPTP